MLKRNILSIVHNHEIHLIVGEIYALEDLRALNESEFTPNQKVGLKYFEELETMIPREEVQIWEVTPPVQTKSKWRPQSLPPSNWSTRNFKPPSLDLSMLSHYNNTDQSRRGAAESPEIDVLLTHPSYTKATPDSVLDHAADQKLLKSLTDKLHSTGHVTHHLMLLHNRYDGIAQLPIVDVTNPPPHRRIKFRLIAWNSFVFGQLHFTGTDAFIIHCREQAAKRGYRLTFDSLEKRKKTAMEIFGVDGLKYMYTDDSDTVKEGSLVTMDSEEDLFAFLQMNYVPPHERNWY